MRTPARFVASLLLLLLLAPAAASQETVASARQLYGAAAYEEALAVLDRIKAAPPAASEGQAVEQVRALCLLALGRQADAEAAIEAVIGANASFEPDPATTSPRVQAAFRDVRRKVLPGIVQRRYSLGKSAYDRKEYWSAIEEFDAVLALIGTPDASAGPQEAAMADLRTLVLGFRDLARSAMPAAAPAAPLAQARIGDQPPPPPAPAAREFYSMEDGDVLPPVAISQRMPRWQSPAAMAGRHARRGVIEVQISETGSVEWAAIREKTGTYYDQLLADQAKGWKYEPARKGGAPVKYRKMIQFTIE